MPCCNLCKSVLSTIVFNVEDIDILQCDNCSHQFADIAETKEHITSVYGDDYFFDGGAGYDNYVRDSILFEQRGERYAKMVSRFLSPGTMIEIGAAAGFGLKAFANRGWKVTGIDPNASMVEYGREHLGLNLHMSSLESWVQAQPVNLVVVNQVLPHLFKPLESVQRISEWLAPGGCILVETWRRDSWTAKITGRGWHEYNPPSVLHWFTLKELQNLGVPAGLEVLSHGRPKKHISGSHVKSLLTHQVKRFPIARFLKYGIDLIPSKTRFRYPAEDLVWILYKKP